MRIINNIICYKGEIIICLYDELNIGYVLENNFSFHTMELSKDVSFKEILRIKDYLRKDFGERREQGEGKYKYVKWNIFNESVRVILRIQNGYIKNDYYSNSITLIINPRSLIEGKIEHFKIFKNTSENVKLLIKKLREVIKSIKADTQNFIDLNDLYGFKLTRIDLCMNFVLYSEKTANDLFTLMKRGDMYKNMEEIKVYDKISKRKKPYKDSIAFSGKEIKINIYNKLKELENNNKQEALNSNDFNGFIRFEIVWGKEKLRKIRQKYRQYELFSEFLSDVHIHSRNEIKKCIEKLFKKGRYFTVEDAVKWLSLCVQDGIIKGKTKDNMVEFLHLVSDKRSYAEAIKECHDYKILENKFENERINLNPVTIPVRWIDGTYRILPSVYEMLGFNNIEKDREIKEKLKEMENKSKKIKREGFRINYRESNNLEEFFKEIFEEFKPR